METSDCQALAQKKPRKRGFFVKSRPGLGTDTRNNLRYIQHDIAEFRQGGVNFRREIVAINEVRRDRAEDFADHICRGPHE